MHPAMTDVKLEDGQVVVPEILLRGEVTDL